AVLTVSSGEPVTLASTVWGAQVAGSGAISAALPLANRLVHLQGPAPGDALSGELTTVTGFIGAGGSNPLPTGLALAPDGSLFVAHFGSEPYRPGTGRIVHVAADGRWQPRFEGLNFPVALAFAPDGQLYVLEFASGYDPRTGRFTPRSGRLLAIGPVTGRRRTIVRDIAYPTALAFSPTGDAYFTESGAFSAAGEGRILYVPAQTLQQGR
ncbi:MAG: ScyD/ScyE family protein, partial [Chloroflexota bacterium]